MQRIDLRMLSALGLQHYSLDNSDAHDSILVKSPGLCKDVMKRVLIIAAQLPLLLYVVDPLDATAVD